MAFQSIAQVKGKDVGPEVTASMAVVTREVVKASRVPIGVQILAGANEQALACALASNAKFIRAECFTFAHVADEGLLEADAGPLMRFRRRISAENVMVLADVKKKHSSHALTADVSMGETAAAAEFFLADGVIVTGNATGRAASEEDLEDVLKSVPEMPTFIGSGVNAENVQQFASAHGFIVGSYFKRDGHWRNPLDAKRIELMCQAMNKMR